MGSYTDKEINRQNCEIEDVQSLVDELKTEIMEFGFNARQCSGEHLFYGLQRIKEDCEYIRDKLDGLKWEPYDTPQTAVDIIGQKE